jgi:hypothetical protein
MWIFLNFKSSFAENSKKIVAMKSISQNEIIIQ